MAQSMAVESSPTRTWRVMLWGVFVVAVAAGVAILVSTLARVIIAAAHGQPPLDLIGLQQITPPSVSTSSYTSITLVFGHVSALVVWLACLAVITQALTQVVLAALIALLAWRLVHDRPFRESLPRLTMIGGVVLVISGAVSGALVLLTNGVAVIQASDNGTTPGAWPLAGRFDLSFIGIGVLLILIGAAFRVGATLQRDTEGLV
ncbi:hypothetical protein [Humibacter sp.]|uniref:hypothetical protein n=1 Tax=Humibacter sp. TaxID=1940291 RepID=UPI003F7F84D8